MRLGRKVPFASIIAQAANADRPHWCCQSNFLDVILVPRQRHSMMKRNAFRYFKTSPEIIQIAVMMYIRFALSLRNVEDLLHVRGIDVCHESIRLWVDRFGNFIAEMIRKRRAQGMH